jgi:hypothetical protein
MVDKSVKRPAVTHPSARGAIFLKIKKAQSPLGNPGSPAPFLDRSFLLLPPRRTSPLSLSALHSTDIKQKIFEKHRLLIH